MNEKFEWLGCIPDLEWLSFTGGGGFHGVSQNLVHNYVIASDSERLNSVLVIAVICVLSMLFMMKGYIIQYVP